MKSEVHRLNGLLDQVHQYGNSSEQSSYMKTTIV
jgi:hypothetical protein